MSWPDVKSHKQSHKQTKSSVPPDIQNLPQKSHILRHEINCKLQNKINFVVEDTTVKVHFFLLTHFEWVFMARQLKSATLRQSRKNWLDVEPP